MLITLSSPSLVALVALSALPVKLPVTLPVTLPVKSPIKLLAYTVPQAFPEAPKF